MRVVVTAWVLVAGLLAVAPVARAQTPPPTVLPPSTPLPRGPSTRDVLDQYLKGDYEAAVGNPPRLLRFNSDDAERWITAGGQAQVERRQLAASLFALEYAGMRTAVLPAMLNWARGVMSRHPPRAIEALWLRCSIALAEGLNRWVFLVQGVAQSTSNRKTGPPPDGHIRFARTRYPDDPYFQMAEAIGAEMSAARPLDRLSGQLPQSRSGWDDIAADRLDFSTFRQAERTAQLERAAGLFERLTSHPTLGPEAGLRLGYVRLRQGQTDAALAQFDQLPSRTKSASLRYLGHLYSGWALAFLGRTDEAVIAYRAALSVVPRAQSATSLLIGLLVKADRLAEAEAAAEEFLVADVAPVDPWRAYYGGEFGEYPHLVRQLREALK
jgi:tetratricopeptide (TPR) repeat protein